MERVPMHARLDALKIYLARAWDAHHQAAQRTSSSTMAIRHAAVADMLADVIAAADGDCAPIQATIERVRGSYG